MAFEIPNACPGNGVLIDTGFLISNPFNVDFGTGTPLDILSSITYLNVEATVCLDPFGPLSRRQLGGPGPGGLDFGPNCDPDDLKFALDLSFENPSNVDFGLPGPIGLLLSSLEFASLSIDACISSGLPDDFWVELPDFGTTTTTATTSGAGGGGGPGGRQLDGNDGNSDNETDDEASSIFSIGLTPGHEDEMSMLENLNHFSFSLISGGTGEDGTDEVKETVMIDQEKLSEMLSKNAPGTPGGHSSCEVIHKKSTGIVCARCKYDSDGDEVVATLHGDC